MHSSQKLPNQKEDDYQIRPALKTPTWLDIPFPFNQAFFEVRAKEGAGRSKNRSRKSRLHSSKEWRKPPAELADFHRFIEYSTFGPMNETPIFQVILATCYAVGLIWPIYQLSMCPVLLNRKKENKRRTNGLGWDGVHDSDSERYADTWHIDVLPLPAEKCTGCILALRWLVLD